MRRASEWAAVDTAGGCAREVYCSAECETKAWTSHEKCMCTGGGGGGGGGGNAEAVRAFLDHAKAGGCLRVLFTRRVFAQLKV